MRLLSDIVTSIGHEYSEKERVAIHDIKQNTLLLALIFSTSLFLTTAHAADTATTSTNPDGSTTTKVEKITSTLTTETLIVPTVGVGGLVDPTGVTDAIRRSDSVRKGLEYYLPSLRLAAVFLR